jgi:hypothetical protein
MNKNNYGELPTVIGNLDINCEEMMFYQYLPIKMANSLAINHPKNLMVFEELINICATDFIKEFGRRKYEESYVYLTAKRSFQEKHSTFNRFGFHSDGFLTDDINYIWSNNNGTIFNNSVFDLTLNDEISLKEMKQQALKENNVQSNDCDIIRLNQYNIHKVKKIKKPCFRTFFKLSFSINKYDLKGNSHNYMFDYKWENRERKLSRNIPQKL